jgi:hypothetical protein
MVAMMVTSMRGYDGGLENRPLLLTLTNKIQKYFHGLEWLAFLLVKRVNYRLIYRRSPAFLQEIPVLGLRPLSLLKQRR